MTLLLALSRVSLACSCGGLPHVFPTDGAVVPPSVVPLLAWPSGVGSSALLSNGEEVPAEFLSRTEGEVVVQSVVPLVPFEPGRSYELSGNTFAVEDLPDEPPVVPTLAAADGHVGIDGDGDCDQDPFLYFDPARRRRHPGLVRGRGVGLRFR